MMTTLIKFLIFFLGLSFPIYAQEIQDQHLAQVMQGGSKLSSFSSKTDGDWLPLKDAGEFLDGLHDHKAKVFEVQGEAKILKHGSDQWSKVQKGMTIETGDQIITDKNSWIRIAYDEHFLNIALIKEKTKAEFRSIEPTDLHLEDGSIFNVVDKLDGDTYQISTPTAVAAVRGTHFETVYNADTGVFNADLFPDGGPPSFLQVTDLEQGAPGQTVTLAEGQKLAGDDQTPMIEGQVQTMDTKDVEEYHQELGAALASADMGARQEALQAPATETKENGTGEENGKGKDNPTAEGTAAGDNKDQTHADSSGGTESDSSVDQKLNAETLSETAPAQPADTEQNNADLGSKDTAQDQPTSEENVSGAESDTLSDLSQGYSDAGSESEATSDSLQDYVNAENNSGSSTVSTSDDSKNSGHYS